MFYYFIKDLKFKDYNFSKSHGNPIIISDKELEDYTIRGIIFTTIKLIDFFDGDIKYEKIDLSFEIFSDINEFDLETIDYVISKNKHTGKWYMESTENTPDDVIGNIFADKAAKIYLYNFNIKGSVKEIFTKVFLCLEKHIYIDSRSEVVSYSNSIDEIMDCWKFIDDPDNILVLNNPTFKDILKLMDIIVNRVSYNQIYIYDDEYDDVYLLEYHNFNIDSMRTIRFERIS